MRTIVALLVFALYGFSMVGQKPVYKLYTGEGKEVTYNAMLDQLKNADVILFGEEHSNAVAHWLELELAKDLYNKSKDSLILGAEMLEADNQIIVDEYLQGLIPASKISEARLWSNFETDYKPLLVFAKEQELPFVATNIPRRYASAVHRKGGFDALKKLSEEARRFIAPLPVKYNPDLSVYKDMREGMPMGAAAHGGMNINNLPKAQAIKDATMAYFIEQNFREGHIFLHFNGRLHSDFHEGITWYLHENVPELDVMTISTRKQADIGTLESGADGIADFVLVVSETLPNTF